MRTILLLALSNVFMTFAWYGHLRYGHDWPLWKAILVSWLIALLEYCLAVPANRLGFGEFSGFQLKIIQEVVTLCVFIVFAVFFLRERLAWNYLVAFAFLGGAAFFAFAFRAPADWRRYCASRRSAAARRWPSMPSVALWRMAGGATASTPAGAIHWCVQTFTKEPTQRPPV